MQFANIKIVLDNGSVLQYADAESLGIKLNRIVDDFSQPDKRFGEYSFSFSLPKTKTNSLIFGHPDAKGQTNIFVGKSFDCKVYDNNDLLLNGLIELTGFDQQVYNCAFFSKYTGLLDEIKGKKLVDLTYFPTISWNYENTIRAHINANYSPDQTDYQFPFVFYKAPFVSGATGQDDASSIFGAEDFLGWYNNYVNSSSFGKVNPRYFGNLPPAFYLRSIVKGILSNAGWSLGGSFFQDTSVKKIIIPFVGNAEAIMGAVITGGTGTTLNLNKLLPEISQTDFLKGVMNYFNLYLMIDPDRKEIKFEPYNTLFFGVGNPYNLNNRIDRSTIKITKPDAETKLTLDDDDNNNLIGGFGRIFDYSRVQSNHKHPTYTMCVNKTIRTALGINQLTKQYNSNTFGNFFNKTTGDKEIKLPFSAPNYFAYTVVNTQSRFAGSNYMDATYPTPAFTVGIPLISEATPNKAEAYAGSESDNYCVGNDSSNLVFDGGLKMYYYYGPVKWELKLLSDNFTSPLQQYKDWAWFGIATGGTCTAPTVARYTIPVASPFKLMSNFEFDSMRTAIAGYSLGDKLSTRGAEAQMLLTTYYSVGTTGNTHTPTTFSLNLGDGSYMFPNVYTYFHQEKYRRIREGYVFTANMKMTGNDWREMQINRTIEYDREFYQLVAIKNYDPVKQSAQIQLLKK